MATITKDKVTVVKNLYEKGFSAREIGDKLDVSIDAVYYCMRQYNIKRRNQSEVSSILFDKKSASFKPKEKLTLREQQLKTAGILLYWAEGTKWPGSKLVEFSNSDVNMIKVFLRFLREICRIEEKRLRAYLYCYANQNTEELLTFWSKTTRIPRHQFTKPFIRREYKITKVGKMKYGLIHIRYSDLKLLNQIRVWIDEFITKYS